MKRYTGLALALGIAAGGIAVPAQAATTNLPLGTPCSEVRDTVGTQFNVKLCDVTDVDQFRTHLAASGNSHCGPSSLYNAMYYLAEHRGLPARVTPNGQRMDEYDPAKPADYDAATAWIGWLGYKAGMGPNGGGSSAAENREAFAAATVGAKEAGWTVNSAGVGTNNTPEFGLELAKRLKHAPVQLWYGRYSYDSSDLTHTRTGGHAVTVVAAKGDVGSGKVELTLHDPARSDDHKTAGYLDSQSSVREEKVTLYRTSIRVKVVPEQGEPYNVIRTYWRLIGPEYPGPSLAYVEAFNYFEAAPPVG
ncbi:hypothetical protein [Kribbella deserti]|uniref:Peptidase C39-like domain-containing protein n=1 Tax=Kribbella deserti TaxID=1926257 RepID=A0ABV6QJV7_9ACTN